MAGCRTEKRGFHAQKGLIFLIDELNLELFENIMLSETIKLRLVERFAAPLSEFHKRRIVFWHDEDGEFTEAVDELTLGGVTLVKLTGKNNFAIK